MVPDCKAGVLQQADGSSACIFSKSSVVVGVYGPCGVRVNKELHDRAVLDVTVQYSTGRHDHRTALLKRIVTCACEKSVKLDAYPHTAISVTVFVKKEDKNLLSCALTACCVALLDAGLSMNTTFGAVTIDPSILTNQTSEGEIVLVLDLKSERLISSHCTTPLTESQFLEGLTFAQNKLSELNELYQSIMKNTLTCLT